MLEPHLPSEPSLRAPCDDPQLLVEEIACAITVAQAALLAGRLEELEASVEHQQHLCASLKAIYPANPVSTGDHAELRATARQARRQSQVFGAALSRMRGHLTTLRNLLHGPSLTYAPKSPRVPAQES